MNHGTNICGTNEFNRRTMPDLPWLPEAGPEESPGPSEYLIRLRNKYKWTKLILSSKYAFQYYKPSEFIGNREIVRASIVGILL